MHKANTQGKKDKYSNREDDFCAMLSILKYKTSNWKIIGTDRFEWCGWIQDKYTKKSNVLLLYKNWRKTPQQHHSSKQMVLPAELW